MLYKIILKTMFVVLMAVLIWSHALSANQKKWLLITIGSEQPVGVSETEPQRLPPAPEVSPELVARVLAENTGRQQYNCLKPETEAISKATVTNVFSWTDASGKRYFSDQAPINRQSKDLSQHYQGEAQYFTLHITSPDGALIPLLKEQLSRDVTAIYRYLTDQLELVHLRKVSVALKVFHRAANYRPYQRLHAPNLEGSVGFFNALSNEAVVLQQADMEVTRQIVRHEVTHVIMAGLYGLTPIWLNEGMAEAFSDYRNVALSRQFYPPSARLQRLREMLASDTLPELNSFLTTLPRQWQQADPALMYPTAWAVVKFMLEDKDAGQVLLAILSRLASQPCAGINAEALISGIFPGGMVAFEQQWLKWLRLTVS